MVTTNSEPTIPAISNNTSYTIPFGNALPGMMPGSALTVDVYADVFSSAAVGTSNSVSLISCMATSTVTGGSYGCGSATGQVMTVMKPAISVVATGTIQSFISPGQTGNLVGQYWISLPYSATADLWSIDASVRTPYLQNVKVYVAGQQFYPDPIIPYRFDGLEALPAGGALVQISADASASATGTVSSATMIGNCFAVVTSTSMAADCNAANGQGVTF